MTKNDKPTKRAAAPLVRSSILPSSLLPARAKPPNGASLCRPGSFSLAASFRDASRIIRENMMAARELR